MITRDSIALAENIAVMMGEASVTGTELLQGLVEESYGALPYSDNWRKEIGEVTGETTSHTMIIDAASTRLAEIIRGAFGMVKTYGVPMARAIADGASILYTPKRLQELANGELTIRYANIDDPFFNSSIYPTEVTNKALSFTGVSFDIPDKLNFDYVSDDDLLAFVDTNHPDVRAILDSKESSMGAAFNAMTSQDALAYMFHSTNGAYDFTRVKSIEINKLLKMYVLISKMHAQSEPVTWLLKGNLQDYREFVETMWGALTTYLIVLKRTMELYRARKLVLVDNEPVKLAEIVPNETLGVKLKVLSGDVTVYYTFETIQLVESKGMALSDIICARLYGSLTGKDVGLVDLLEDKDRQLGLLADYHSTLNTAMDTQAHTYFIKASLQAIAKFVNEHPAAREALVAATGDKDSSIQTIIRERMESDIDKLYYVFASGQKELLSDDLASESGVDASRDACIDTILQTRLVPTFLRLLGCDLAAEIIEITFVQQVGEDNLIDQRSRLHGALIEMLAGKLVG